MPEPPELNPVILGKLRLALVSLLAGVQGAEFSHGSARRPARPTATLAQLLKLEQAGYLVVEKKVFSLKPQTIYCLEANRKPRPPGRDECPRLSSDEWEAL